MKDELITRFLQYVKIDTQAQEKSPQCPSSEGQRVLGNILVAQLKQIGLQEITMDSHGYVMATLPANTDKKNVPTIGFMAHLDTATDLTGANVKPQLIENYDGKNIILNQEQNIVLSPADFPELSSHKDHTLITTDGTTLLGADDKAGIAEIMTAINFLLQHPEIPHGRVRIAFTPDEEIGRGPHRFDVRAFDAQFAYTVDGSSLGGLQYENFNAAVVEINCHGKVVHPGSAKGKMINALKLAIEIANQLPQEQVPEQTEGYAGFFHLTSLTGTVDQAHIQFLIRDFSEQKFAAKKVFLQTIIARLNEKYGHDRITYEIKDQYFNMRKKIEPVKEIIDVAKQGMLNLGINPVIEPIRGGTDGAQLSFMGLPTPNLFTGGENYHGRYEYVCVDTMIKATELIIQIIQLCEQQAEFNLQSSPMTIK